MLSQTAEYALRALLYLAGRPDSSPVPAGVVARAINAPENYLAKTLNGLARKGIVSGTRGPNGGFRLHLAPCEISLADVMDAFGDPSPAKRMCLLGGAPCSDDTPCTAHTRWQAVWRESTAPLARTTLADLLTSPPAGPDDAAARPPRALV